MNPIDVIVIALALVALVSIVLTSLRMGISPMPSSRKAQKAITSLIPKETNGLVFELGSGWGSLIYPLARSLPQATVIGIEISIIPWTISRVRASLSSPSNLHIQRGNFHDISLEEAEVIVCYLHPSGMESLKTKFEEELKPNTLIVSNTFGLAGWNPKETFNLDDIHQTPIYCYRVPVK